MDLSERLAYQIQQILLTCQIKSCLVVDHLKVEDHQSEMMAWFYFIWNQVNLIFVFRNPEDVSLFKICEIIIATYFMGLGHGFDHGHVGTVPGPSRPMFVPSAFLITFLLATVLVHLNVASSVPPFLPCDSGIL